MPYKIFLRFTEICLWQQVLAIGSGECSTYMGERNGVKAYLTQWNSCIIYLWCLAHRLNLTVKDAPIEVTKTEHFINLMHSTVNQNNFSLFEKLLGHATQFIVHEWWRIYQCAVFHFCNEYVGFEEPFQKQEFWYP